jgi:hypothetical protein
MNQLDFKRKFSEPINSKSKKFNCDNGTNFLGFNSKNGDSQIQIPINYLISCKRGCVLIDRESRKKKYVRSMTMTQ